MTQFAWNHWFDLLFWDIIDSNLFLAMVNMCMVAVEM